MWTLCTQKGLKDRNLESYRSDIRIDGNVCSETSRDIDCEESGVNSSFVESIDNFFIE